MGAKLDYDFYMKFAKNTKNSLQKQYAKYVNIRGSGFSLVEMMLAVSILLLAIGAPLFASTRGVIDSRHAMNKITARMLAQEAIEYIISVRDTNERKILAKVTGYTEGDWARGFSDSSNCLVPGAVTDRGCQIDVYTPEPLNIVKCVGTGTPTCDEPLRYVDIGDEKRFGYYDNAGGDLPSESIFIRTLRVRQINNNEYTLDVEIKWDEKGTEKSLILKDQLYRTVVDP